MKPHIEFILPVFNEVDGIRPLLDALSLVCDQLENEATFSYLFINDGSQDGTKELLDHLFRERKNIRVVELIHNFGHAAAITCGLENFKGDAAILMDTDLQDDPKAIIPLFNAWKKGAKTAVAERGARKEKTQLLFRSFYYLLHKVSRTLPPINFGTFCVLDKSVVKRITLLKEKHRYFPGLVNYSSNEIIPIRVDRKNRYDGKSRVGLLGLIQLAVTAFVSNSNAPVRLASLLGLICAGGAMIAVTVFVSLKLFTHLAIPGWASMMTAISFFSGIQLLCLGIIGEYIARINDEVRDRPIYIVDHMKERTSKQKTLSDSSLPEYPAPFPRHESATKLTQP